MDGAMEAIRDFVKGFAGEEEEQPAPKPPRPTSSKVTLHVYDFLEQGLNGMLRQVGTGGFHCAVEVHGKEWSFRRTMLGTGIYWIPPKSCTAHKYRESVPMGKINMSEDKFLQLIHKLKKEWPGSGYDILRRNCCIFSNELCKKLGLGPIPDWITNLAGVGADLRSVVRRPLRQMEEAVFGEEPKPEERSSPAVVHTPGHSQPGGGRASSQQAVPGRPSSRRDGYEKLEHGGRRKPESSRESMRQLFKQYAPSAVLFFLFLCLCALAGAAGAGRLPRPSFPWSSRGKSLRSAPQTVVISEPPAQPIAEEPLPPLRPTDADSPKYVSTDASTPPKYDCDWGFDTWVVSWSIKQSAWCCNHAGRGCRGSNATSFNCEANFEESFEDWSPYELDWCCLHRQIGCSKIARGNASGAVAGGGVASGIAPVIPVDSSSSPSGNATAQSVVNVSSSHAAAEPLVVNDRTALLTPPLIEPIAKVHDDLAYTSADDAARSGFELEDGEAVDSEDEDGHSERRAKHDLFAEGEGHGRSQSGADAGDADDDVLSAEAVVG